MLRSHSLLALLAAPMLVAGLSVPALAADASIDQVYAEAKSGNVQGALGMMDQVLKDHPNSAKAHFIEAELLAHAHRAADASGELAKAQQLAPGLPFATPRAVGQLKAEIGQGGAPAAATGVAGVAQPAAPAAQPEGHFPWAVIIIVGLVVFGMLALLRRRAAASYAAPGYGAGLVPPQGGFGGPSYGGPGYGAPGYGPGYGGGYPPQQGGMGSGIIGGLASGAAMGAGFAVGEEAIDHMFGGGRERDAGRDVQGGGWGDANRPAADPNADYGGNDFGISDSGSWDDGGNSGGGGDGGW